MTPYYSQDGITIFHGDCREVLPDLEGVVVSDPPYNVGYHYTSYADRLSEGDYLEMIGRACRRPSVVIHYPEDMFAISRAVGVDPSELVAWVYNAHTPRKWRLIAWFGVEPDFDLIQQPFKNPNDRRIQEKLYRGVTGCGIYDWWHVEQVKNVSEQKTCHPCQIPLDVMVRAVGITPADQVIDPFMGSGTTLVAAKQLGRKSIGIEIEERYCEIAAKRLAQGVLELTG